jgi:nucleoside-diphosphate-sugar epimerase
MKIFVAGGTGAIGRPLIVELLAKGHALLMFANYSDTLCAFLRLKLTPHPAFGTPLPNGRGARG